MWHKFHCNSNGTRKYVIGAIGKSFLLLGTDLLNWLLEVDEYMQPLSGQNALTL